MPAGAGIAMLRDEDPALAAALLARQQRRPPRWTVAAGPGVKRGAPMGIRKSLSIVAVTAVLMVGCTGGESPGPVIGSDRSSVCLPVRACPVIHLL